MAAKKTNRAIEIEYAGTTYILEYDRESIERAERVLGLKPSEIQDMTVTGFTNLFHAAFIKHHNRVKRDLVNELLDNLSGKEELFQILVDMYSEAFSSLTEDTAGEAKASWKLA